VRLSETAIQLELLRGQTLNAIQDEVGGRTDVPGNPADKQGFMVERRRLNPG
jgi:hypothetical protein